MRSYLFIIISCLVAAATHADQPAVETPAGTVSSTHAEYDGNELLLHGHVMLNHGLGKMNAEHAALQKQEMGKDFPFSFIHLEKEVFLHLKDNAKLFCERADLDFLSLKGLLFSKENEKVTYTDILRQDTPFKVLGKEIELEMSKMESEEKKNVYQIESITAKEAVTIHYDNDFILEANYAHYRKYPQDALHEATREFPGRVLALPKDGDDRCHLHHLGDLIDARQVDLDILKEAVTFEEPVGRLVSSIIPHPENSEVLFHAGHLIWEQPKNTLTLRDNIHVQDSALGIIDANDELKLIQEKFREKTAIKNIFSKGKTRLEFQLPNEATPQILICHGNMVIDRDKLHGTLISPEIDGTIPEEKQIYYEETKVSSFADRANIDYSIVNSKFTPVSVNLNGNIRLFSNAPKEHKRCSIADRLIYAPTTHTLIMSSNPNRRVLFWDEEQELCISAQEIHIIEDPETKNEAIKGVGNVKFAFTSEESELLHQIFPFYKKQETPSHEPVN